MQTYFADLLAFFGISGAPQTFAELIPWMFGVLVALGIVLACFRLISECINAGRWFAVWGACIYGPPDVPYIKLMRFQSSLIQGVEIMERATL